MRLTRGWVVMVVWCRGGGGTKKSKKRRGLQEREKWIDEWRRREEGHLKGWLCFTVPLWDGKRVRARRDATVGLGDHLRPFPLWQPADACTTSETTGRFNKSKKTESNNHPPCGVVFSVLMVFWQENQKHSRNNKCPPQRRDESMQEEAAESGQVQNKRDQSPRLLGIPRL